MPILFEYIPPVLEFQLPSYEEIGELVECIREEMMKDYKFSPDEEWWREELENVFFVRFRVLGVPYEEDFVMRMVRAKLCSTYVRNDEDKVFSSYLDESLREFKTLCIMTDFHDKILAYIKVKEKDGGIEYEGLWENLKTMLKNPPEKGINLCPAKSPSDGLRTLYNGMSLDDRLKHKDLVPDPDEVEGIVNSLRPQRPTCSIS